MITEEHANSKQPVSPFLVGPYGHPFHPILVTVPIGAWVGSLVFDVASRINHSPEFLTRGSEWLVAIGILGALAAASIGFLDFCSIPPGTAAYRTALLHLSLNLLVTLAYALGWWWRYASTPDHGRVLIGQIVLSGASLAVLALSGALGGKLAYHYGVRVADEQAQAAGFRRGAPTAPPTL